MSGDQEHSPFFELINRMFDHIAKVEPRVNEIEWKVRILWWIVIITVGGGTVSIAIALLTELAKKYFA